VRSYKTGVRVKRSTSQFITDKLKLKVNKQKSTVCDSNKATLMDGRLIIAKESVAGFKSSICEITRRNRGVSSKQIISELNQKLRGWFEYFKYTPGKRLFRGLVGWIRRRDCFVFG